jgi:hypothetical protein
MSAFLDALMKLSVQFLSKQSPLRNMLDSMAEQSALLQHFFSLRGTAPASSWKTGRKR